jgi:chromosome partitioning protein
VGLSYNRQGYYREGSGTLSTSGLGWPSGTVANFAVADGVPAGSTRPRRNGQVPNDPGSAAGLGWPGQPGKPEEPSRLRSQEPLPTQWGAGQASRGVQVNDGRSGADGTGLSESPGVPNQSGAGAPDRDPVAAMDSRETKPVVVPEVPADAADTPIARAARAAVVRGMSDRQPWPRPSRCRIMTIANQKGGVGKTTTAVNLAASLALHGAQVLVVDLDPQGNASTALDVDHRVGTPSVYDVLIDERPLAEVVRPAGDMPGLFCAPATIDLAGAEIELVPVVARELRLAKALRAFDTSNLDYVLLDCPPSLGLLTLNALVAAEEVLLPIQCEYYALEGVQQLLNTAELVRVNFNPGLHVSTVLLTMYDGRTRLASDVADDVRAHFGSSVLRTIIPRSVRVSEAPSRGQSVISYDPASSGAVAYTEAARELALQSAGAR